MNCIQVQEQFNMPVEIIFELLAKHDTYNQIFAPALFVRIKDAEDVSRPDGIGSIRQISIKSFKLLKEKIIALDVNKRIEYQIIQNPLVQFHLGVIEFEALSDKRTMVTYTIQLKMGAPFMAKLILSQLKVVLKSGFIRLAKSI
ncbi:MxaD family protein [Acinetobacter sp. ANC 4558]|uniref:SRPBCC family protein n=1 Tax=Acinetobacter sp. ANC 4558 TaxID=1977876 RepID=UPI000A32CDD4|nr:SRPBCC family protein [Acinetobacter sp. ANC 4558]OTG86095.1 MxaD family protein [Acinetobacter sp. ANC 4558]